MDSLVYVSRRYLLASELKGRVNSTFISRDMLSAINTANALHSAASDAAQALLAQAEHEVLKIKFEAAMDAQKMVWSQALSAINSIDEAKRAFLASAHIALGELLSSCISKFLLDTPSEAALQSSVRLLLQDWRHSADAVLEVPTGHVPLVSQWLGNIRNLRIEEQPELAQDECRLLFGHAELQTSFHGNVEVLCQSLRINATSNSSL